MSWSTTVSGRRLSAGLSLADSDRFGIRVSRVTVAEGMDRPELAQAITAIREQAADVSILRYPARETTWFAGLLNAGFKVLFADTLVYWRLSVGSGAQVDLPAGMECRAGALSPRMVDLMVQQTFDGYRNHYSANPAFDPIRALAGYQEWARLAASADDLVCLFMSEQPVAFASFQIESTVEEVLLAGVVKDQQGRGHYHRLLSVVERQAASRGITDLVISTQGHNIGVQRVWARYGFEPASSLVTLHVMPGDGEPPDSTVPPETSLMR